MAVTEMLLGERAEHGLANGITYDPQGGLLRGVVNGAIDTEPITQLRERFAKLKARDNLLGAVLVRLGADPGARETEVYSEAGRLLDERAALVKIARGLGLDGLNVHDLPVQVLAMNTELTAALASSKEDVRLLTKREAVLQSGVDLERSEKLQAMTALEKMQAERDEARLGLGALKRQLAEADLERTLAEARAAGLSAELLALEHAMREELRA